MATVFIDPTTGERYENVPDAEVERAQAEFGLVPLDQYEAEQRSGGLLPTLRTIPEEAIRGIASGAAGIAHAVTPETPAGLTELEPGQQDRFSTGAALTSNVGLEGVYSPEAIERRRVNPVAAGIGNALPALPLTLYGGLAGDLTSDLVSGYMQEAVDAELENRDISGSDVLRNFGLNAAFSVGAAGIPVALRKTLSGGKNVLEKSAEFIKNVRGSRAAAAEGADLAEAVADTTTRDDLLATLAQKSDEAVAATVDRLERAAAPKVANNPNAQRDALETLGDAFEKSDPGFVAELKTLQKARGRAKLTGLRELRAGIEDGTDIADALDNILSREDLWGADAIRATTELEQLTKLRPVAGAGVDELQAYADAVRKFRKGEFAGLADQIDQLAERQAQVRVAATLGPSVEAATKGVDYGAALRNMDEGEAWRLKQGGGIDALRKTEAHTAADAFQRVDGVLKEDIAMSVKRSDFIRGAETWSPEQIAKQEAFTTRMYNKGADLLDFLVKSKGASPESGFALAGFAARGERLLNTALTRLADADPVTRNYELDQLKRGLDSIVSDLGANRTLDSSTKAEGVRQILGMANELRRGLESAELFGKNAGLQEATNDAWKKLIEPYGRVKRKLSDFLGREFGNIGVESGNVIRFEPQYFERAFTGDYARSFRTDLKEAITGIDQLVAARQTNGLSRLDSLAEARADLQRISDAFEMADVLRVADSTAKEPLAVGAARRAASAAVGGVTGAVVGGLPGAVIGSGIGALAERGANLAVERVGLLKPGSDSALSTVLKKHLGLARSEQSQLLSDPAFAGTLPAAARRALMAAGDGATSKTVELAASAADAAKADRKLTARLMVNPEQAKRYLRVAGDLGSAITRFQGENETPEQAFQGYRALIEGFDQNPERLINMLTEEFGDVGDLSPKLQREMTEQAIRVSAYLRKHLPGKRNVSVVYPNGTPPSNMEIRQFALRFTAATDPAGVMNDARAGRLRQEQVEALKELWPREYNDLRTNVLIELGSGSATTAARQSMSILFGFDSGVDPALGSRTRAVVQAARSAQERQAPSAPSSAAMRRQSPPSKAGLTPGGIASLQLGQAINFNN